MSSNLKKYDERDPNELKIELKGAKITRTQKILDKAVSITDKSENGVSVNVTLNKSKNSIDVIIHLVEVFDAGINIRSVILRIYGFFKGLKEGDEYKNLKESYNELPTNYRKIVAEIMYALAHLTKDQSVSFLMNKSEVISFTSGDTEAKHRIDTILEVKVNAISHYTDRPEYRRDVINRIKNLLSKREQFDKVGSFLRKISKDSLENLTIQELEELLNQLKGDDLNGFFN